MQLESWGFLKKTGLILPISIFCKVLLLIQGVGESFGNLSYPASALLFPAPPKNRAHSAVSPNSSEHIFRGGICVYVRVQLGAAKKPISWAEVLIITPPPRQKDKSFKKSFEGQ